MSIVIDVHRKMAHLSCPNEPVALEKSDEKVESDCAEETQIWRKCCDKANKETTNPGKVGPQFSAKHKVQLLESEVERHEERWHYQKEVELLKIVRILSDLFLAKFTWHNFSKHEERSESHVGIFAQNVWLGVMLIVSKVPPLVAVAFQQTDGNFLSKMI